jgi:hypothetical protein
VQAARRRTPADDRPVPAGCSPGRQRHGQQDHGGDGHTRGRPKTGRRHAACRDHRRGRGMLTTVRATADDCRQAGASRAAGPAGGAPPEKRARPLSAELAAARKPGARYRDLAPGHLHLLRPPAASAGRVHPADSRGGRGSPTGSLTGSQPPPPSSHTQPHRAW